MFRRFLSYFFFAFIVAALYQCARRGSPTGGPKDMESPVLTKAVPENMSVNFSENKIRLYFDEYITLKNVQEQLIISPPLQYIPDISPQSGASKYVEITIKDTLKENTTYTLNFGESIVDYNEGNPNSFLTYVFSTGNYIDSLEITGVIKDAYQKVAEEFVTVMLYEIDSTYTDSTIYKRPPNYITNTLDSTVIFTLKNLKKGTYALFGLKDEAKNNIFDQNADKIAFLKDTISIPTDSIFLLNLFKEVPDYSMAVPTLTAKNKITFGYYGDGDNIAIKPLSSIPDSVQTRFQKAPKKDSIYFWFTPYAMDSLVFRATNEKYKSIDTFTVKHRKIAIDTLTLTAKPKGNIGFQDAFNLFGNTPLVAVDTAKIKMINKDSIPVKFSTLLDTLKNAVTFDFEKKPEESYLLSIFPGAITDFFNTTNDSISIALKTKSVADYGTLRLTLEGNHLKYPLIVQLTNEKGVLKRELYATEPQLYEFNTLEPDQYIARVIFDANKNKKWDTGNYLLQKNPEKISYYPFTIEVRANWEVEQTFTVLK